MLLFKMEKPAKKVLFPSLQIPSKINFSPTEANIIRVGKRIIPNKTRTPSVLVFKYT